MRKGMVEAEKLIFEWKNRSRLLLREMLVRTQTATKFSQRPLNRNIT